MATLRKETVQKLAVLRALSLWKGGALGPLRLHKTLFFSDKGNAPSRRLFTFKKWRWGQYSDEVADALNALRRAGRLEMSFEGPAERLKAQLPPAMVKELAKFFARHFSDWDKQLRHVFPQWAYLRNDAIIAKAHEDPTYKQTEYGNLIFGSELPEEVDLPNLDPEMAERLSDLVDERLHAEIDRRLREAAKRPAHATDWRAEYFGESVIAQVG